MSWGVRARLVGDRVIRERWTTRRAVVVAGAVLTVGVLVASLQPSADRAAMLFVASGAWVVLGVFHRTRSTEPIGAWAVIAGSANILTCLDEARDPWLFTAGNVIAAIDVPLFLLILVTFPTGRLSEAPAALDPVTGVADPGRVRGLRRLLWAAGVWAVVMQQWVLFDRNPNPGCPECAGRNHVVAEIPALAHAWAAAQGVTFLAIGGLALWACERAFRTPGPMREVQGPVRVGVRAILAAFATFLITTATGPAALSEAAALATRVLLLVMPLLFAFGLYRWADVEQEAIARLASVNAGTPAEVEAALRTVLRDPLLTLHPTGEAPLVQSPTRAVLRHPDGTALAMVSHGPRAGDRRLVDRAFAWAADRLATAQPPSDPPEWADGVAGLTDAELSTARRLANRRTNREIADELGLSLGSVNNRVSRIYRKLDLEGLSRRERAATLARLHGLLDSEARARGVHEVREPHAR